MTTPSFFENNGLNISVFKPDIDLSTPAYDPTGGGCVSTNLANKILSYSHEIGVDGWFKTVSITISDTQNNIEQWIAEGLCRSIFVYNAHGKVIWEGFCNSYNATVGAMSTSGGPLMNVVNRLTVTYNPQDTTANPPANGPQTETTTEDNTTSQGLYGILEDIFSAGNDTEASAEQKRDAIIADDGRAFPGRSGNVVFPAQNVQIALNFVGYNEYLSKYIFNDTTALTTTRSDKIESVLSGDPNGLFSTDYSYIDANASLVGVSEDRNKKAMDIIRGIVVGGDAAFNRWTFGIRQDRVAHYHAIPTTQKYQLRLSDPRQRVELYGTGTNVNYWDIVPGEWIFVSDYLVGRAKAASGSLRTDPRNIFIESVVFSAPNSLQINGYPINKLDQLLASQSGLAGVS